MPTTWNGDAFKAGLEKAMGRRIDAACMYLASQVKADISQPGTLRYGGSRDAKGRYVKGTSKTKTVYNFTHSRPGNPPYKQMGTLRASITWERSGLVGRVGTNLMYGLYLELGTGTMAPRPFLRPAVIKHKGTLTSILTATIKPGELPAVSSNQFRPGHFGAGAKAAGY